MPLIDKYSKDEVNEIDNELKSFLIEYAIKTIKDENFADKLRK